MSSVQTPGGDRFTYNPRLSKTITAASTVYRQEQREIAQGDRVLFTRGDADLGVRKGETGSVTSIGVANNLEVRLDNGSVVQLISEQTRYIEHAYAVKSVKTGAPDRVLFTHNAAPNERELATLSRNGREVSLYTSDGSVVRQPEIQSQIAQNQTVSHPVVLPQQSQFEAPVVAITPQPAQPGLRIRMGR